MKTTSHPEAKWNGFLYWSHLWNMTSGGPALPLTPPAPFLNERRGTGGCRQQNKRAGAAELGLSAGAWAQQRQPKAQPSCHRPMLGSYAGPVPRGQAGRLPSAAATLPGPRLPPPACLPSPPLTVSCFASLPVSPHSVLFCSFSLCLSLSLHVRLSLSHPMSLFGILFLSSSLFLGLSPSLYLSLCLWSKGSGRGDGAGLKRNPRQN